MNWVGGSRSRLLPKDEAKKQRDFFDRMKMQQRLKNLGLPSPNSEVSNSNNLDFVSLFLADQMAVKKENKDPPKVSVLSRGGQIVSSQRRNHPLVLPMVTLCAPSKLNLVESHPKYSLTRKRKHVSQLSPVIESAFSDNSASDYAPGAADAFSPAFSPTSTSSASSGHGVGQSSLQLNQQQSSELQSEPAPHCAQPSSSSGPEHPLPKDMMDLSIMSGSSDVAQQKAPSAVPVLYGRPSPLEAEGIDVNVNPVVNGAFRQSDGMVPVSDFSLNQSEEHFEENMLRSFNNGEYCLVEDGVKSNMHFMGGIISKPSKPQTPPETQNCELPSCSSTSLAYPGNSGTLLDGGRNSPRCFSSDSNDDEKKRCSDRCKTSSTVDPTCAESYQSSLGTSGQIRPFPPFNHRLKIRAEVSTCLNELNKYNNQQSGSKSTPLSLQSLPQTKCKCWTKCNETHEVGTQTDNPNTTEKCDFGVQCVLMPEPESKPPMFRLSRPPIEAAVQRLSTRGNSVHSHEKERNGLKASPGMTVKNIQENLSCEVNHQVFTSSGDALWCGYRAKQSEERCHEESILVLKSTKDEVKDPKSGAKANASDDASTLQEIADILLLLKQKSGSK